MKMLVWFFSGFPLGISTQVMHAPNVRQIESNQIIISEIMADPYPPVLLPDVEYIELFNRGKSPVDLEGWKMVFGRHEKMLDRAILEPGGFLIICESGTESHFQPFARTLPMRGMPAIVNTGQTLTLKSPLGTVIHTVSFSPGWYNTRSKSAGGWSLEIIDPDNPCAYSENWSESADVRGGSPGTLNSVNAFNPDIAPPVLMRAVVTSDTSVMLMFSERMDSASMNSPWLYSASGGLLHPVKADPAEPDYASVMLSYTQPFLPSSRYTLSVGNTLRDCAANTLVSNAMVEFAMPQEPGIFDVIINEVMFNPAPEHAEFIELYNRSANVFDLADFSVSLADAESGEIGKTISLNGNPFLLFPGCYAVISSNARALPHDSFRKFPGLILEHPDLFTLPDEEGIIVLSDDHLRAIDEFHYSVSMHSGFLNNTKGVSLERISCNLPSSSLSNWHSASTSAGYSTPGLQNSQELPAGEGEEIITISETFSPDNDGSDDLMNLYIKLSEAGWKASIMVFDRHGRKIRDIASNTLLGTEEQFTWDGTCNSRQKAGIGIYLVYAELITTNGEVKNFKKVVTLIR